MSEQLEQEVQALRQQVEELRQQAEALRVKTVIYEQGIGALADGFFIVGRDGHIIDMNKAYCDFLGTTRENVIGKPVQDVIYNSKMTEVMDKNITELDSFHHYVDSQSTLSGERHVAVSRLAVSDGGKVIAAVALVKFSYYTIQLAKSLKEMETEVEYYRKELRKHGFKTFEDLPSISPSYEKAKRMAIRFAASDLPILLLGETGVGKEVFAHAVHQASDRRTHPFISVNCASIPSELIESELFGYVDGAFTGSRRGGKKGKFELANGGTLFLDEIGDMPTFMQSKLLRVLQSQEVEKLGAEKSMQVDVRIIAATHQDLQDKVEDKTFRADLFYRLNVLPVTIPPMRERVEDIHILATHFLEELNEKYSKNATLAPETTLALMQYAWPGNVRELRNVMGRCFMMTDDENIILPKHLPSQILPKNNPACSQAKPLKAIPETDPQPGSFHMLDLRAQAERNIITSRLQQYEGNFSKTAKALGIHRTTLYAKVDALQISVEQYRKPKK